MDITKAGGRGMRGGMPSGMEERIAFRGRGNPSDEFRKQFDDLKERHKVLRHQCQMMQGSRDTAIEEARLAQEQSNALWKKVEELKRERGEMQKKLSEHQRGFAQRGQVSRFDHENLAKRFDQMCAQAKMLQFEKEQLEKRHQQEKQDIETHYLEDLKSLKASLEDADQDRDNLRYELSEYKRKNERLKEQLACVGPSYDTAKREIDRIIDQRDQFKAKVNELKRENLALQDRLASASQNADSAPSSDVPSDLKTSELQSQVQSLRDQVQGLRAERDQLLEMSGELRKRLQGGEGVEARVRELEAECQRLQSLVEREASPMRPLGGRTGSSEEMLALRRHRGSLGARGRFSQGSTDEDFPTPRSLTDSDNPNSLSDLAALTRSDSGQLSGPVRDSFARPLSFAAKKKLSSSTSNLVSEFYERAPVHSRLSEQNNRLRAKLSRYEKTVDDLRRENQSLSSQVTKVEQQRSQMDSQLQALKGEVERAYQELTKVGSQNKMAKDQIEMLNKEKGVAMRDNATSYQQSIQMETQLRELQAEKQILEQQRNIANKERERVISDVVALRKKLEMIKAQRHKDAKDLSMMKHLKDKAVTELGELRKAVEELERSNDSMREDLAQVQEAVNRASLKSVVAVRQKPGSTSSGAMKGKSMTQEVQLLFDRLQSIEHERKVVHKKLFGQESLELNHTLGDVLHRIESLFQERDNLVVEIEALQQSSSKLNEDRIFELKQKIEDLLTDRDSLSANNKSLKREVSSLSSRLVMVEQDKDKLLIECERKRLECQQLKNTQTRLVQEQARTLERVNELWKQKWPTVWDESWEEKHVTVPLGADGFAGFSVVGGRDQPQLPNPGAFLITMVNPGGPADGLLKVGDVLELVNGINLTNADHREAVRVVKESKGALKISLRRRRNAYPIQMGIVSAINAVPHLEIPTAADVKMEQYEYSLYITGKEHVGFHWDWSAMYTVTEVVSSGPANQILEKGDHIIKVNNTLVSHEKPSVVKKLMKPHKNILRLVIERPQKKSDRNYTGQSFPPPISEWSAKARSESPPPQAFAKRGSWAPSGSSTPNWSKSSSTPPHSKAGYHSDEEPTHPSQDSDTGPNPEPLVEERRKEKEMGGGGFGASGWERERKSEFSRYQRRSRDSYSRDAYSQETNMSQDSTCRPTKLVSVVTQVKRNEDEVHVPHPRPVSDGVVYGNFNERRIEYEDILTSERTQSEYSQSESYLSESSYGDYGLSSSQSYNLSFHSLSAVPQCSLTVGTVMTTQNEPRSQHSDEEEGYGFLARDDASRTTFRTRHGSDGVANGNSNSNNSEIPDSQLSMSQYSQPSSQLSCSNQIPTQDYHHKKLGHRFKRQFLRGKKSNSMHGSRSLTKLSSSDNGVSLGARGRSRSNLSLGHAPSMTSVIEEPRRSTSITNVSDIYEHDPLADASYIRANFTYIPRSPRELSIKTGDVFHIHDEAPPERFRASFWVSRLSADGTDEQIGAIPNSIRAQEYLEAQGESLDIPLYEEVEAFTGRRPVLVFGALADQVTTYLLESYPHMFYPCPIDMVEGVARITEARLRREAGEGKIIDFRRAEGGFEVIRADAINSTENKGKHCLLSGTIQALQSLKGIAPPITILVKAMTEESITTFSPEQISLEQAKEVFEEVTALEDEHGHEFSASLFLIYMDTLMGQIEDITKRERRKQAWVPVTKET